MSAHTAFQTSLLFLDLSVSILTNTAFSIQSTIIILVPLSGDLHIRYTSKVATEICIYAESNLF